MKGLSLSFLLLCCGVGLYGNEKAELKSNMQINYLQTPNAAENFEELFSKGTFYGRLRANSFLFEWDDDSSASRENHYIAGIGGSLIFKSARLHGFGFETGLYTAQNPWHMNDSYAPFYKAGKGVFESTFTASNDTKMIPNSFEGLTLQTSFLPNTDIKLAYLRKEKLRDHSNFHHLFAYGDGSGAYSQYTQNDDTAMHQGITMSALKQRGIDDVLYIAEFTNKSLPNSEIKLNITVAPELITLAMIEAKYNFKINDTLTLSPALRYIRQFDEGAGAFAGANLKCDTADYKSPDSLDGSMFAAKLDLSYGAFKTRLGYSEVADKADLVTPWRGFPTGGYTRAMAQYNWYANTKSSMIRFDYDFDKAGLIDGVSAFTRF
ncbi:MAG: OprD family outer membrane porin, partial [Sulfurovaceae bacterium]